MTTPDSDRYSQDHVSALAENLKRDRAFRRKVRTTAGLPVRDNRPVEVVEGENPPTLEGEGYYFTTACTTRVCKVEHKIVHHPNAYGWRVDYHHSTRRVVVGRDWHPSST